MEPIRVSRIVHTIHAVADIAACRARYLDVLGGLLFAEGYFEPEDRDMALLYVADHMIEPMAPRDAARLDKPYARYLQRFGEGLHSFEIMLENGPEAAARLKAAGCKLASDYGVFFFVRQESTGGVLVEATELPMPNDPYGRRNWRPDLAEGHPSTLARLDHIACVTRDLDAALGFFTGQLDGELVADERTLAPQPARRARVRLGGTEIAFLQPDAPEDGPLSAFLARPNSGLYALVWRVEDEAAAEAFIRAKGLAPTREGCAGGGFAIDPRDFFGARHEFVQG